MKLIILNRDKWNEVAINPDSVQSISKRNNGPSTSVVVFNSGEELIVDIPLDTLVEIFNQE